MGLIEHFERYLGEIEAGWSADVDGDPMPFQVVRFPRGSGGGTISFATVGLSRYPLVSPSGQEIRHEVLMIVPAGLRDGPIPGLLQQLGMESLAADKPLLRGGVIGPRGALVPGSEMTAVYVAIPVYFPDEFAVCGEGNSAVVIVWLVPISTAEAGYVMEHGWRDFEQRLLESDPDLTDIYRTSLMGDSHIG